MFGVYWENTFPAQGMVICFLYIPEYTNTVNTTTGAPEVVPATIMYRGITDATPQKSYRYEPGQPTNTVSVGSYGDPTTLAIQVAPQLVVFDHSSILSVDANPEFSMREPIFIEINDSELGSIREKVRARSLQSRIWRARAAAGWPDLPGGKEQD